MLLRVTTKSEILRLLSEHGALKDSQLAQLLGVAHQQVNQAARGLEAVGLVARVAGSDGVIRSHPRPSGELSHPGRSASSMRVRPPSLKPSPILGPLVAGARVARVDLDQLGFMEHVLQRVPAVDVPEAGLIGWNTVGDVPKAPGLYCFVGRRDSTGDLRLFYVGMTTHLWMVTKGRLPSGMARGGQRYGRPRHAGETRRRVNAEIARMTGEGWTFTHWLREIEVPIGTVNTEALLRAEEARLIGIWRLREVGWNRA